MDPSNPFSAPEAAPEARKPLGSLAQSARGKELRSAQVILIIIGLLTIAMNGFLLYNLPKEVAQAAVENQVPPNELEAFNQAVSVFGYLIYGGALALGVLFFVFGLIVKAFPVPITISSLVLYILAALGFALINPMSLAQGLIMKVIIIVALVRAVKAARAYQDDMASALATGELPA